MPSLKRRRPKDAWVVVAEASSLTEAEIIGGLLRTAEIPYQTHEIDAFARIIGISFGGESVQVLVPAKYADEAIALLDEPTLDDTPPGIEGPTIDFPTKP